MLVAPVLLSLALPSLEVGSLLDPLMSLLEVVTMMYVEFVIDRERKNRLIAEKVKWNLENLSVVAFLHCATSNLKSLFD